MNSVYRSLGQDQHQVHCQYNLMIADIDFDANDSEFFFHLFYSCELMYREIWSESSSVRFRRAIASRASQTTWSMWTRNWFHGSKNSNDGNKICSQCKLSVEAPTFKLVALSLNRAGLFDILLAVCHLVVSRFAWYRWILLSSHRCLDVCLCACVRVCVCVCPVRGCQCGRNSSHRDLLRVSVGGAFDRPHRRKTSENFHWSWPFSVRALPARQKAIHISFLLLK